MTTSPGPGHHPAGNGLRNSIGLAADLLAIGAASVAAIRAFFFTPSLRSIGFLLVAMAFLSLVSMVLIRARWIHALTIAALAATVGTTGGVFIYKNPPAPAVEFVTPSPGDTSATCVVDLRFRGKPNKGTVFVVATRQNGDLYYFETSVQQLRATEPMPGVRGFRPDPRREDSERDSTSSSSRRTATSQAT